jgi:Proline dehydrogenase
VVPLIVCLSHFQSVHCVQVLERERASQMGTPSPIHDTIEDTHLNYNRCVRPTDLCYPACFVPKWRGADIRLLC